MRSLVQLLVRCGAVDENATPILASSWFFLLLAIVAADFVAKGVGADLRAADGSCKN
jgi:hypothetical protein